MKIGEVAERTGLAVRTIRYYEELGLLAPSYDASSGHRVYAAADLGRLHRVSLLRRLGTPLARMAEALDAPDGLAPAVAAHLAELDERMAALGRLRERVTSVEEALQSADATSDEELASLLQGVTELDPGPLRRLTLLVYDDIEAAHDHLVTVFGFGPGTLTRDESGVVHHGEIHVGDGVVWMHHASPLHGLASPRSLGASTHCMAVFVDDVDEHHRRAVAAGAEVVTPPRDMEYGVREYDARDIEGGLWSFMQPLTEGDTDE
ncbi:MAG: MerR family transcriptional regulator [Nocardioidaceae bacterium]|nr:MerR family transcriptional regulator [Nocardioidaceae bacterium]